MIVSRSRLINLYCQELTMLERAIVKTLCEIETLWELAERSVAFCSMTMPDHIYL